MRIPVAVLAIGSLLLAPARATAQSPWSLELTTDAALPTEDLGAVDLEFGVGSGANIRYRFQPHLAAYAGWETHQFWSDADTGPELDVEDTGYTFGIRFEHPLGSDRADERGSVSGWIRAGGLLNHIEVEDEPGSPAGESDHGLGWEAAVGVSWSLGRRVAIAPGIRYRRLARELAIEGAVDDVTLAYVAAAVSVVIKF